MVNADQNHSFQDHLRRPWGHNSVEIEEDMSVDEMLNLANLNWKIEKVALYADRNGIRVECPKKVGLFRTSDQTIIDVATDNWNPYQNLEAIQFMDTFVKKIGGRVNYLGQVKNGMIVFGLSELQGEKFDLFRGKVTISSYLLVSSPHIYGQCCDIRFTAVNSRCYNMLTQGLARRGDLEVRLRHHQAFDPVLTEKALLQAKANLKKYEEMAKLMATTAYETEDMMEYFHLVFPSLSSKRFKPGERPLSKPAKVALEALETQPGAKYGAGTWWQVFNAVTYVLDHHLGRSADNRLYNAWYGGNRGKKNFALNLACEFAGK